MPGILPGQIYTYPAKRWRKKRRSYLVTYNPTPKKKEGPAMDSEIEASLSAENSNTGPIVQAINEDSKDSAPMMSGKEEASKVGICYLEYS